MTFSGQKAPWTAARVLRGTAETETRHVAQTMRVLWEVPHRQLQGQYSTTWNHRLPFKAEGKVKFVFCWNWIFTNRHLTRGIISNTLVIYGRLACAYGYRVCHSFACLITVSCPYRYGLFSIEILSKLLEFLFCPHKEFGEYVLLAFVFWCSQSFSSYRDLPFASDSLKVKWTNLVLYDGDF